jgi:hypothetical protein
LDWAGILEFGGGVIDFQIKVAFTAAALFWIECEGHFDSRE